MKVTIELSHEEILEILKQHIEQKLCSQVTIVSVNPELLTASFDVQMMTRTSVLGAFRR